MKRRFFTMSTSFAAAIFILACLALGSTQPMTAQASERATLETVQADEGISFAMSAPAELPAAACSTAQGQDAHPFVALSAPLNQAVCCGWLYWCDYYYCYEYYECWYC